ncbi:transposase [Polaromonas sp. P2-4]|nr:transposase [Polaromonas sp. P2-4]
MRQRSTQILSIGNLLARNLGSHASGNEIKRWQPEHIDAMPLLDEQRLALKANLAVMRCLDVQVQALERSILAKAKLREDYLALKTVSGIGEVLALTIALETGDVSRFDSAGNFASYAHGG